MKDIRIIGYTIDKLMRESNVSQIELANKIGCSCERLQMGLKGRGYFSYPQISKIAKSLGVSNQEIVQGDPKYYSEMVVDCMTPFSDENNREEVLDIIYDYLDILDFSNQ